MRRWIEEQAALLTAAAERARDTLRLLGAAADTEPAPAPQRLLRVGFRTQMLCDLSWSK